MNERTSHVADTTYKVLQVASSVLGGMAAGAIFTRLWARFDQPEGEPPVPQDLSQKVSKVLVAAAAQGAIFAVVRAVIDRIGAHGYQKVTGEAPTV